MLIEFLVRELDVVILLYIYIFIWNYIVCNLINFLNYLNKMDSLYRLCLNLFVVLYGLFIIYRLVWRVYFCVDFY